MKNLIIFFFTILLITSCSDDDSPATGSFSYTVSGTTSASVSGIDTNFGLANGEAFISLIDGTDDLVIRILIDPISTGTYNVNPILVNQQNQPIIDGDAFADLGLGSTATGDRQNFSTNAGNGGTVTLSSVSDTEIKGSFNVSMLELLAGGINQPEVNVTGSFTASKQ